MASDSTSSQKLYYSIGEVADMFDVNTSLIRFWEKEFDIIKPKKNKKGNRSFTVADIENVRLIHYLVKERGFTLQGAKLKLKDGTQDAMKEAEVANRLQKVRSFLLELKDNL